MSSSGEIVRTTQMSQEQLLQRPESPEEKTLQSQESKVSSLVSFMPQIVRQNAAATKEQGETVSQIQEMMSKFQCNLDELAKQNIQLRGDLSLVETEMATLKVTHKAKEEELLALVKVQGTIIQKQIDTVEGKVQGLQANLQAQIQTIGQNLTNLAARVNKFIKAINPYWGTTSPKYIQIIEQSFFGKWLLNLQNNTRHV